MRRHYGTVYRSQGTAEWVEGGQVDETKTFQYVREIWKPCNPTGHETVRGFTQCLNASTASNPLSNRQEDSCESLCTAAELVIDFRKLGPWSEEVNNIQADFEHCTMTKLQLLQDVSGLQNYRILRNCWLESSLIICRIQKMPRWKCRCLKSHPSSTLCTSRQVEGLRRPTAGMQMFFFKSVAGTCEALRLWHVRDSTNILDGEAQAMVLLQVPRWCLGPSPLWTWLCWKCRGQATQIPW